MFGDIILTGSNRNNNVMQLYSASLKKLVYTFEFNQNNVSNSENGYVLGARFSYDGNFIFAGGAGKNELKAFMNNCDKSANFKIVMEIKDLPAPVVSLDANK